MYLYYFDGFRTVCFSLNLECNVIEGHKESSRNPGWINTEKCQGLQRVLLSNLLCQWPVDQNTLLFRTYIWQNAEARRDSRPKSQSLIKLLGNVVPWWFASGGWWLLDFVGWPRDPLALFAMDLVVWYHGVSNDLDDFNSIMISQQTKKQLLNYWIVYHGHGSFWGVLIAIIKKVKPDWIAMALCRSQASPDVVSEVSSIDLSLNGKLLASGQSLGSDGKNRMQMMMVMTVIWIMT